ncbi:MAG: ATP-binding protein [Candidatus Omnitrophica bacterium]|nr:ATP-binding protein [Candidatus Omnitrophota bacterium]
MVIAVASGKGGTGKTTIATSFALSLALDRDIQLVDCDVEEPNAHLFLDPLVIEKTSKGFIPVPQIDQSKCNYCGKCSKVCAYNAIAVVGPKDGRKGSILVFEQLCHGCGACSFLCPRGAIKEVNREIGAVESGWSGPIQFIHGRLNIGEAMAPPLIRQVKENIDPSKTVIIDAPPGTSCPVVTSVEKSDFCILVTEPTPFGLNDLILAVEVLRKLKIPFGVVLNRSDLGNEDTEKYCVQENISILMRVPFDEKVAKSYSKGIPIVRALPEFKNHFKQLYEKIDNILTGKDR